jgi:integrase/recombinase XerC/integrase/recombinase XerD
MPVQNQPQRIFQIHTPSALHNWVRDFLLDVRAANRTDATIEYYREKLRRFLAFLESQGITQPEAIQARQLRAFLVELSEERTAGGVHAHWRAVRAFVRFLVREEAIADNPLDKVRSPRVDQELLEPAPLATINAMLKTCDKTEMGLRDKALLLTLLDTGLRASELTALNVGDIDLNDGSVAVRRSKGRKGRIVFVGRQASRAIATYLRAREDAAPNAPLWLAYQRNGTCTRLAYDGARDIVRRRAKQAGVDAPSLHSFRRAFALTMLRSGADVVSLSRMMGHGSLPVLQRYLKQVKEDLGEVHRQHSPVDSMLSGGRNSR